MSCIIFKLDMIGGAFQIENNLNVRDISSDLAMNLLMQYDFQIYVVTLAFTW